MTSQSEWEREVRRIYEKVGSHKEPYSIDVNGVEVTIFPNVFSPAYFTASKWFAETIPKIVGNKSLLEIGTGTGIVSLFCALNGADVTATDLNCDAVKNAKYNFEKHRLKVETYCGNVYEPLPRDIKYDFIFWNHPFNRGETPDEQILLKAGFDFEYQSLEKYISNAGKHLSTGGRLLLGTGGHALVAEIEKIASKYGYKLHLLEKSEFPISKNSTLNNEFRIYELKR